jgi:DNA polymerase III epsilon subunit-like protein
MNDPKTQIIPSVGNDAPIREPIAAPPATGNIDRELLLCQDDFAIVDVETTGVDPDADEIIEIAILRRRNGRFEAFHSLVNPGFPIPPTSSAVNHITDEDVQDAPRIEELRDQILDALDGSIPVAFNAAFDALFVDPAAGVAPEPKAWLCAMRLAKHLYPDAPGYGNQTLRYWLKTKPTSLGLGAHRAIDDCYVTLESFLHMLKTCQDRGLLTLDQVFALANEPIISATCPFHKYQDVPWAEVPQDYIEWTLRERDDIDEDLRIAMQREIARRAALPIVPAKVMTFGKAHKGKPLAAVPTEYFEWMQRESKITDLSLQAGIEMELASRRNGAQGFLERCEVLLAAVGGFEHELDYLAKLNGPAETRCGIFVRALANDPRWPRVLGAMPDEVASELKMWAAGPSTGAAAQADAVAPPRMRMR